VLQGKRGAYLSTAAAADVNVPATLQATIASRIDLFRLESETHVECGGGGRLAVWP
jgi:hypothetical protein